MIAAREPCGQSALHWRPPERGEFVGVQQATAVGVHEQQRARGIHHRQIIAARVEQRPQERLAHARRIYRAVDGRLDRIETDDRVRLRGTNVREPRSLALAQIAAFPPTDRAENERDERPPVEGGGKKESVGPLRPQARLLAKIEVVGDNDHGN
jgi:hypothetical protein